MPGENIKISAFTKQTAASDTDYIVMLINGQNALIKKSDLLGSINEALNSKLPLTGGKIDGPLAIQESPTAQAGYMGSCEDLLPGYTVFYISGNAQRHEVNGVAQWTFRTNGDAEIMGTTNGGAVIAFTTRAIGNDVPEYAANLVGVQIFKIEVPTGFSNPAHEAQILTDAQMLDLAQPL